MTVRLIALALTALGHCRLSIVDLSAEGNQPLHDDEHLIHAVVNGEIYEHHEIRQQLERDFGYRFRGNSDSEVVVALYKFYGLSFLSRLRGEFSLCLYDCRTRSFVAARDRFGIKPLFYTRLDSKAQLLFAVEAKAFLPLGWKPKWEVEAIVDGGYYHDTRTVFKGVEKIRPGYYMTVDASGRIEHRQYWDAEYRDKEQTETRSETEMITGVRSRLVDAIRVRLRADVPIGIYLSGGIDSSAIAGIVTHLLKDEGVQLGNTSAVDKVCCFSIGFDEESGFDESVIAKRTADWLGVKFVKKKMDEAELAQRFEDAVYHTEHHVSDLNFVGKFALSEEPHARGYKVVLTGEGWDEHFAGYRCMMPDFLREADLAWPRDGVPDRQRGVDLIDHDETLERGYEHLGGRSSSMSGSHARSCIPTAQVNGVSMLRFLAAFQNLPFADWTRSLRSASRRETIARTIDGRVRDAMVNKWHPLHTGLYIWSKIGLPKLLLTSLGDRIEMAHSIEARPPFLDHKLTEYVNNLPPSVKIRYDAGDAFYQYKEKWILKEAVKPFITQELYERRKFPYTAPLAWPMNGPLYRLLSRLVTETNVARLGFLKWSAVEAALEGAFVDRDTRAFRLLIEVASLVTLADRFGVPAARPLEGTA